MDLWRKFGLFRNVEEILKNLSQNKHIKEVQELLNIYDQVKEENIKNKKPKKHPLIILEGLDGTGKTTSTRKLAKRINATIWLTPPESIRHLRLYFDKNLPLRTAYYSLGNYIAGLEIECLLAQKPIVMDRFWHSTTAYAIAQCITDNPEEFKLPEPSEEIYKWPVDLLKPDRVIFLYVSEATRVERHSRRDSSLVTQQEILLKDNLKFRDDITQAYKYMRDPEVTFISSEGSLIETCDLLYNDISELLQVEE